MTGNRVEELEEKVRSLEATVDGLTDELVECKERIEHLEAEIQPEPSGNDIMAPEPTGSQPSMEEAPQEKVDEAVESADDAKDEAGEESDEDSASDDIIVA